MPARGPDPSWIDVPTVSAWRRAASKRLADEPIDALAALEADLLLAHALDVARTWLIAHGEDRLHDAARLRADALLERRLHGEPIAYLLGQREFMSREFAVDARVLVPRDDTELLVNCALQACHDLGADATYTLVDAGTGSGIVAISLALALVPRCRILALDRSLPALAVAMANARRHGAAIEPVASDWLSALDDTSVELIVANPPYLGENDPHLAALGHEPRQALVSGAAGREDHDRLIVEARRVLRPGGSLLLEHGFDQGDAVRGKLLAEGYEAVCGYRDDAGHERVAVGRCRHGRA